MEPTGGWMATAEFAEFDIERPGVLLAYLRQLGRLTTGDVASTTILAGGVSNRTVLVEPERGEAFVVKQALAKLRVAVDWFSPPQRIHREAMALRWLTELAPSGAVVPFLFEDDKLHLLGMGAVPKPNRNWKAMLLAGELRQDHVAAFGLLLGRIHREAWVKRDEIERPFRDRGYFESLRLEPYYAYTAERIPAAKGFLSALIDDVRSSSLTLVHGDYSPKNVLVYDNALVLLDHEVVHWGDPAFDLGFGLTHLLSKAHHVAHVRDRFAQAATGFWAAYAQELGDVPWRAALEGRAVRAALGCLLARVDGRSPLEYLDAGERDRQRRATLALMAEPPPSVAALVDRFVEEIGNGGDGREPERVGDSR